MNHINTKKLRQELSRISYDKLNKIFKQVHGSSSWSILWGNKTDQEKIDLIVKGCTKNLDVYKDVCKILEIEPKIIKTQTESNKLEEEEKRMPFKKELESIREIDLQNLSKEVANKFSVEIENEDYIEFLVQIYLDSTNESHSKIQSFVDAGIKQYKIEEFDKYDKNYEISESLLLRKGLPVLRKDNIFIETSVSINTDGRIQLFHKKASESLGYYTLVLDETTQDDPVKKYYLIANPDDLKYDKLEFVSTVRMIVLTRDNQRLACSIDIETEDIDDLNSIKPTVLAIDFGTSNTTAGSFRGLDNIDIVTFETNKNNELSKIYPTVVYVDDCSDPKNIKYLFGYDAKEVIEKNNYLPQASFFYSLKKWVYSSDKVEIIKDKEGHKAKVTRKSIIKEYLQNVINFSNHHFGINFDTLHFSTPVKQQENYIKLFEKLFGEEYNVVSVQESIDEGMSIVYGYIRTSLQNSAMRDIKIGEEGKKLLIMDSGGGTTDLSSVKFTVNALRDGSEDYKLNIVTGYERGASTFGGNNITYRIFKLIKIKLADIHCDNIEVELKKLLSETSLNEILKDIDINGNIDNVYGNFEEEYKKAEIIIPTKFTDKSRFSGKNIIRAVKQNFYLLWEIAEIVKIEFFKQSSVERITFNDENRLEGKIRLPEIKNYNISIFNKENTIESNFENDIPALSIGLQEVKSIILPEIYYVIKKLIGNDSSIERNEYNAVVLSGQTSKINLYSELLKEFIPGKKLREALNESQLGNAKYLSDDSLKLKLKCVEGSILYFMDKEYGKIIPNIINENKKIHYKVKIDRSIDAEKEIWMYDLDDKEQLVKINFQTFDANYAKNSKLSIISNDGELSKVYHYRFKNHSDTFTTLDEIKKDYFGKYLEDEVLGDISTRLNEGSIEDRKIIMAIPDTDKYGFNIYDFDRINNKFTKPEVEFVYFEDYDSDSNDFFNGSK